MTSFAIENMHSTMSRRADAYPSSTPNVGGPECKAQYGSVLAKNKRRNNCSPLIAFNAEGLKCT